MLPNSVGSTYGLERRLQPAPAAQSAAEGRDASEMGGAAGLGSRPPGQARTAEDSEPHGTTLRNPNMSVVSNKYLSVHFGVWADFTLAATA